jgi:hypothetical protein
LFRISLHFGHLNLFRISDSELRIFIRGSGHAWRE